MADSPAPPQSSSRSGPSRSGSSRSADASRSAHTGFSSFVSGTRVPQGVIVVGDVAAEEDLLIDGELTGSIDMPAHALTIGEGGRVDARIFARDVTVLGTLVGRITATEIVDVRDGAAVTGEVAAPSVLVADGATVQGRVDTKRVDAAVHVARYRMARNASA
jgi:cytoskeletal protein CcmA (bactofilin family)